MIRSIPTKAVTATPDTIQLPNKDAGGWSLRNDDGTYSIFYIDSRDYPDGAESAFAGASKAVLKALGGSELRPGEVVYLPNLRGTAALTVVCVTGGTASMDIESGEVLVSQMAGMTILKTEVVTITNASATLKSLLAGAAYQAGVKQISLKAAAAFSVNVGAAATMGAVMLDASVLYEMGCTVDTDLRIIAGGDVACLVVQEG